MPLCVVAADAAVRIAVTAFTLAWTHSVERQPWEEHWQVAGTLLRLIEVRVQGSGAGMEPPADAHREGGWYVWRPLNDRRTEIILRRFAGVEDWRLCTDRDPCRSIGEIVGADADPVTLRPCP